MSFRKEIKFRLNLSELSNLKKDLIKIGMKKLYNRRKINSCYFDTKDLSFFSQSEEGTLPRRKIRVRWYDDEMKFFKETKISSIEGRFKLQKQLNDCNSLNDLKKMKFFESYHGLIQPIIIVSYLREYYFFKKLRITMDYNISYIDINSLKLIKYLDRETVLEVKTSDNISLDYIQEFICHPTSRFSKYSRGLLAMRK
jgi:hypothetical protein